jgi:hypothetical protein
MRGAGNTSCRSAAVVLLVTITQGLQYAGQHRELQAVRSSSSDL